MNELDAVVAVPTIQLADDAAVITMVVVASADAALCDATYLPPGMDYELAAHYLTERSGSSWVLHWNGEPCGLYELGQLHGSLGIKLPPDTFEREVWLLEPFRGRGIVHRATQQLEPALFAQGVRNIVGVAWTENRSAIRGMEAAGFWPLGRTWWQAEGFEPGWCEAWLLELAAPDTASEPA